MSTALDRALADEVAAEDQFNAHGRRLVAHLNAIDGRIQPDAYRDLVRRVQAFATASKRALRAKEQSALAIIEIIEKEKT